LLELGAGWSVVRPVRCATRNSAMNTCRIAHRAMTAVTNRERKEDGRSAHELVVPEDVAPLLERTVEEGVLFQVRPSGCRGEGRWSYPLCALTGGAAGRLTAGAVLRCRGRPPTPLEGPCRSGAPAQGPDRHMAPRRRRRRCATTESTNAPFQHADSDVSTSALLGRGRRLSCLSLQ
jgi:hypothetical protein